MSSEASMECCSGDSCALRFLRLGGKMKATSIITAARLLSVFCFLTGVLFGQTAAPPETLNGATAVQTDASAHPAPAAKAPPQCSPGTVRSGAHFCDRWQRKS